MFTKDSLETLRQRIDLVDVLSSHIDLKRAGVAFKALCPFHDEKTPSFVVQKGERHYHCFGCGAHGDAIQFLMMHIKMSFTEAVESLAQRFQVPLVKMEGLSEQPGPNKAKLKEALGFAAEFYHFLLLHTPEGHLALEYLYGRGLSLDFIRRFQVGYSTPGLLLAMMQAKGFKGEQLAEAGLVREGGREFFIDRILFPIQDAVGSVIGFSGRKFKETTTGGKYVNTPETALFKKNRVLFGLHHSRKRIAKEQKAIVVEGQIDALQLIHEGFNYTVAGQGTAFGENHAQELINLGVKQVFLALDGDEAGRTAALKIGDLFLKSGVEAKIVPLPLGQDPDNYLKAHGAKGFEQLLQGSKDYITFSVECHSKQFNIETPAGKSQLVQMLAKQIRSWGETVLVHEGLKRLAHLTQVPEDLLGVGQEYLPNIYIKRSSVIGAMSVDPDKVMEGDFLRWLLLMGNAEQFLTKARAHLKAEDLLTPICRSIYEILLQQEGMCDLLSIVMAVEDPQAQEFITTLLSKRVNKERAEQEFLVSIQRLLDRKWMNEREAIKRKIQSGQCSDDEVLELVKQFDETERQTIS